MPRLQPQSVFVHVVYSLVSSICVSYYNPLENVFLCTRSYCNTATHTVFNFLSVIRICVLCKKNRSKTTWMWSPPNSFHVSRFFCCVLYIVLAITSTQLSVIYLRRAPGSLCRFFFFFASPSKLTQDDEENKQNCRWVANTYGLFQCKRQQLWGSSWRLFESHLCAKPVTAVWDAWVAIHTRKTN